MSDIEAIEYRIESTNNSIMALAALACVLTGLILVVIGAFALNIGITGFALLAVAFGVIMYLLGIATATRVKAREANGRWRNLWSKCVDYEDPPLEEWAESLEERNAFPVDGDD